MRFDLVTEPHQHRRAYKRHGQPANDETQTMRLWVCDDEGHQLYTAGLLELTPDDAAALNAKLTDRIGPFADIPEPLQLDRPWA